MPEVRRETADDPAPVATDLPPDPDAYDSPRASQARSRGLAAPYITGGEDPELEQTRAQERRFVRLLIVMIVIIVLSGFVLGIAASLLGLDFLVGSS
jgi:hypothetical protein